MGAQTGLCAQFSSLNLNVQRASPMNHHRERKLHLSCLNLNAYKFESCSRTTCTSVILKKSLQCFFGRAAYHNPAHSYQSSRYLNKGLWASRYSEKAFQTTLYRRMHRGCHCKSNISSSKSVQAPKSKFGNVDVRDQQIELRDSLPPSSAKPRLLPNGLLIHSVSEADVDFLYHEIWEERSYLMHGISIGPGDTVVDVGANIGLFAIQAARECPGGRVLAFEPIPSVCDALRRNVALNAQGPTCADVEIINAGLSDGRLQETLTYSKDLRTRMGTSSPLQSVPRISEFTFYERAAGWSTMVQDEEELQSAMDIFLAKALSTGEGLGDTRLAFAGRWLQRLAPPSLFKQLSRLYVQRMLKQASKATCPLFTLSQVIEELDIQQIDLLKIDVERAELDVLKGIKQSDWPKIKQVVMEVHDVNDRLQKVADILKAAGVHEVVHQQSRSLEDSTLFNLYAKRPIKRGGR